MEDDPFDLERLRVNPADFQRTVAIKTAAKARQGRRLMGAPWAFWVDVCRLTGGRATLVVAVLIYRRTRVCHSSTVTLPGAELVELGIDRRGKNRALTQLAAAGLIQIERTTRGRTARVTLLWHEC